MGKLGCGKGYFPELDSVAGSPKYTASFSIRISIANSLKLPTQQTSERTGLGAGTNWDGKGTSPSPLFFPPQFVIGANWGKTVQQLSGKSNYCILSTSLSEE